MCASMVWVGRKEAGGDDFQLAVICMEYTASPLWPICIASRTWITCEANCTRTCAQLTCVVEPSRASSDCSNDAQFVSSQALTKSCNKSSTVLHTTTNTTATIFRSFAHLPAEQDIEELQANGAVGVHLIGERNRHGNLRLPVISCCQHCCDVLWETVWKVQDHPIKRPYLADQSFLLSKHSNSTPPAVHLGTVRDVVLKDGTIWAISQHNEV